MRLQEIPALETEMLGYIAQKERKRTDTVNDLITRKRAEYVSAENAYNTYIENYNREREKKDAALLKIRNTKTWAATYEMLSAEEKHMILPEMIRRVVIFSGYNIEIDFDPILEDA